MASSLFWLVLLLGRSSLALHPLPQQPRRTRPLLALAPPEGASVASSTINLVKTLVGAGVLSAPVGVAAFSSSRAALMPSVVLVGIIGAVSAYSFAMVGRVCEATGSTTWGEAWSSTVGESTAWIPSVAVALLCFSASLQYTMVIGDSFSSIFAAAGLPEPLTRRWAAIAAVTALGTLPLSLLPNLEMLKYTSSLGIAGLLYTAAFMVARVRGYAPGSALHDAVPPALRPRFSAEPFRLASMLHPKVFVLLSILATAYCAHFLAPQFLLELADDPKAAARSAARVGRARQWRPQRRAAGGIGGSTPVTASTSRGRRSLAAQAADGAAASSKLPRFSVLTAAGFGLSAVLTAVVMGAGFLTFGGAADGYILNNYAASDRPAQLARLAIGGAIVTTYPLLRRRRHQGLRETVREALARRGIAPPRAALSLACIGLITALGMRLTDLGTVAAVSGALVSTSLVYALPSIMFGQMLSARVARGDASRRVRLELLGSRAVTALGIGLSVVGMRAAL